VLLPLVGRRPKRSGAKAGAVRRTVVVSAAGFGEVKGAAAHPGAESFNAWTASSLLEAARADMAEGEEAHRPSRKPGWTSSRRTPEQVGPED
jgi:hypothetical protein